MRRRGSAGGRNRTARLATAVLLLIGGLSPAFALAQTALEAVLADATVDPEARGLAVAEAAERAGAGFSDSLVAVRMVLHDARGSTSEREMRIATLEGANGRDGGEGDRSLIMFDSPRDQRGTALLTWNHAQREDDQWLYLPSLRRVKKIAARNRSGPFVGSEFAFEDLTSEEIANYTWRFVAIEACGDAVCLVVERFPVERWSGYSRQRVHYDAATLRIERIEYYDRRDAHLKTLEASRWTEYDGGFWRAGYFEMTNHQTGRRTELEWGEHAFGNGFTVDDFSTTALQRVR